MMLKVTGAESNTSVIECYALRSDIDIVGSFNSSSALLNAIHVLERTTAEANMMSIQSLFAPFLIFSILRRLSASRETWIRRRCAYVGRVLSSKL